MGARAPPGMAASWGSQLMSMPDSTDLLKTERENVLPVLIEAGIEKADCFDIVRAADSLSQDLRSGLPKRQLHGCVKATSPTYWNHVRKVHPEQFAKRAEQSREIGVRLARVSGKRIFLDELKETDLGLPMKKSPINRLRHFLRRE